MSCEYYYYGFMIAIKIIVRDAIMYYYNIIASSAFIWSLFNTVVPMLIYINFTSKIIALEIFKWQ